MDRKKVIKATELLDDFFNEYREVYYISPHEAWEIIKETLKEQTPQPVYYETNSMTGLPISHCPSCGEVIHQYAYGDIRKTYYCPYCGQEVKWE